MRSEKTGGVLGYFTTHRTAASFVMVLMLILGFAATTKIRSQFFPDVVINTVTVSVKWNGAGPEEMDSAVVALLEPALQSVEGVATSTAVSKEDATTISLTLEPGWDIARATEDVKSAVESVRTLPEGTEEPVVRRGVWRDKVTEVVIHGPAAPDEIARIGDDFVARLFRAGITRTTVTGIAAPQIEITVPEASRVRHDVALKDIALAVAREVDTSPAGDVAGANARLRAGVETRDADAIRDITVKVSPDGSKLYVRNLGTVSVTRSDAGQAYYMGGEPAVLIRVDRTAEGDAIGMEAEVRALASTMETELPEGVQITLINARAQDITDRLNILMSNGFSGLILVLVVLFLFLSARTAFWVAMGIPVSMLAAVGVMYLAGYTVNMMSLFALIITLGIVVDDAIVVAEHADYRHRAMGESADVAPVSAVRKMLGPVFSSTITTVLAFIALLLIGGEFGSLVGDIPVVVTAVLAASLIESFLILPNHMRHALHAGAREAWYDWPSRQFNRGFAWMVQRVFRPLMTWVIRLRYPVVAAMLLLLALSAEKAITGEVPWAFYTAPERASVTGNFAFLPGHGRSDALAMAQELDRAVAEVARQIKTDTGIYPVVHVLTQVGGTAAKGIPGEETMDPDTLGSIDIGLVGADLRDFSAQDFVRYLNAEIDRPAGIAVLSFRTQGMGPSGDSLAVNFYGTDSRALKAAATDLTNALGAYPEVTGLQDSLPWGKDDMVLQLTPQGEALGFTTAAIGAELFGRLNGITAVEFPAGTRTTAVTVQLPEGELHADFLDTTLMRTPSGDWVPLGEIVQIDSTGAFSTVTRENGRRLVSVTGALSEDDPVRAAEIAAQMSDEILPAIASRHNVSWDLGGLALQQDDFFDDVMGGVMLCILGIYMVLAWVFGSWLKPLIVMAVIPFGLIGTIWGHAHFGLAMSLFTIIGLIGMSGIIINDAIVLVTTVRDHAKRLPIVQAVVQGTSDRLRPILLTTLTTVLGLAPLMYEESRQSLFLKPTVVTLVYGLSVGFFVVLFLVPSLLVIQSDASHALGSLRRALGGRRMPFAIRTATAVALATIVLTELGLLWVWLATGQLPALLTQTLPGWPMPIAVLLSMLAASIVVAGIYATAIALGSKRAA